MYKYCIEKGLIHTTPTKESEEHVHKPNWHDSVLLYISSS